MSPVDALGSQAQLDSFLRTTLRRLNLVGGDLDVLVARSYGAYPTDVRRLFESVPRRDSPPPANYAIDGRRLDAARSRLPIPHPLDFEWRFSADGAARLRERLVNESPRGGDVALLGTPAFAERLSDAGWHGSSSVLFERQPQACAALRGLPGLLVEEGDVGKTSRGHARRFTAAVADPPWYPEASRTFVQSAATLLQLGGVLMLCAPGIATRPGVAIERAELVDVAIAHGFILEELSVGFVEYESPPFELAALSAAGLPQFHTRWRRGDLLTFRKVGDIVVKPLPPRAAEVDAWKEVRHGRARIRVKTAALRGDDRSSVLREIVPGDVLDSVSSRDARRAEANVWTTTNRIWHSSNPSRLLSELRTYGAGGPAPNVADGAATHAAAEIVLSELDLLGSLGVS